MIIIIIASLPPPLPPSLPIELQRCYEIAHEKNDLAGASNLSNKIGNSFFQSGTCSYNYYRLHAFIGLSNVSLAIIFSRLLFFVLSYYFSYR